MKNFLRILTIFVIHLFNKRPEPLDSSEIEEVVPVVEDPNSVSSEEVEGVLAEVDDANPDTPEAPEVIPDTPEVEETYEVLDEDTETSVEDLIEIGGGVEIVDE